MDELITVYRQPGNFESGRRDERRARRREQCSKSAGVFPWNFAGVVVIQAHGPHLQVIKHLPHFQQPKVVTLSGLNVKRRFKLGEKCV